MTPTLQILTGDCREQLRTLPEESVHCCVTSPPYWGLRDYGHGGQLGQEATPGEYIERMVEVFEEVRRVLRKDGTLWLNLGDTFAGSGRGAGDVHSANRGNPSSRTGSRALGNSMAVPVMRWIGERIQLVDSILEKEAAEKSA